MRLDSCCSCCKCMYHTMSLRSRLPLRRHYRNRDMRGVVSSSSKPKPSLPRITRGARSHAAEELLTEWGQKFFPIINFYDDWSNLRRRIWNIWGPPYIALPLSHAENSDPRALLYSARLQRLTVLHGRWYSSCRLHDFSPILKSSTRAAASWIYAYICVIENLG